MGGSITHHTRLQLDETRGFTFLAKKYISRKLPRQNENLPNMREHKPKGIDLFHVVRARRNTDSQTSKTGGLSIHLVLDTFLLTKCNPMVPDKNSIYH